MILFMPCRRWLLLLVCWALFTNSFEFCTASAQEIATKTEFQIFQYRDAERRYVLHLPEDLPKNAPLVFFLHGYHGDARNYAKMGMSRVADTHGFAVVYPQGKPDRRDVPHWNARLQISDVDDVGFLAALAKDLQHTHDLDPQRTFTSGVSNGGFMSYTLVAERPEVFKAVASIIGTMSGYTWEHRDTIKPTPVLQISGLEDKIVPVDGSMRPFGGWGGAPDQKTIIEFWKDLDQTTTEEVIEVSADTTAYRYGDGVEGCEVWLYEVKGWGHRVPGSRKLGVHSVDLVWEFFSQL
ncbi:MAG: prolyl oligopeptidase family serine peptidase [Planctomycetaceae bacterium]|nr:prolyl oligopeptidase family serine peptidase [Planctomycetaceae bacterium]MBT6458372.1 prolyl oligopeptidase family serine peptidase [Planctomycetaceae bacterium]